MQETFTVSKEKNRRFVFGSQDPAHTVCKQNSLWAMGALGSAFLRMALMHLETGILSQTWYSGACLQSQLLRGGYGWGATRSKAQEYPQLHSAFEANLGYLRLCLK